MQTKIIQFVPVLLALLFVGFRYFSNWCIDYISGCYGTWISHVALSFTKPFYFYALPFLPIAIILIFVPRIVFQSWLRLAAWFIPLSLLIIFITPVTSNSWMPIFFIGREEIAWYLGILFSAASLILIVYKYFSLRHNSVQA